MSSRETIARIIDPAAFLFTPDELGVKDYHHPARIALEKADRILALSEGKSATEGEWRPIETAPKDGTTIDVWDTSIAGRMTVWWKGGQKQGGWWADNQDYDGCEGLWSLPGPHITHWMPLPASPTGEDR